MWRIIFQKVNIIFVMFVRPSIRQSARYNSTPPWTNFREILHSRFLVKSVEKFQVGLKSYQTIVLKTLVRNAILVNMFLSCFVR